MVNRPQAILSDRQGRSVTRTIGFLLLLDDKTKEEVEGYLQQDPFVKRGKLGYGMHPRYGKIGTLLR